MESDLLVSVHMITYNHEDYISAAIEGVLAQVTDFRYELIISDDCSSDSTSLIIAKYAALRPEIIKPLLREKNIGSMANFLDTFNFCSGKYIALCEGDDYWCNPYKLRDQVFFLENNKDIGLVWTDVDFYNQEKGIFIKEIFEQKKLPVYNDLIETLINKPFFSPPTWIFRREYIPQNLDNYCDGTFPMILDILAVTKIKFLNVVTAVYRQLPESASHSRSLEKRYKFLNGVYKIQLDYSDKYKVSDQVRDTVNRNYHVAALPYAVVLNDKTVEKKCLQSLAEQPKTLKTKVLIFLTGFSLGRSIITFIYKNDSIKSIFQQVIIF